MPKSSSLGSPAFPDQDVRRLEVAVHHQLLVGVADRAADLAEEPQAGREVELFSAQNWSARHAVDQLHHQVGPAARQGAAVVELGDLRAIEGGQDLPLGEEPLVHDRRLEALVDHLERHLALELRRRARSAR